MYTLCPVHCLLKTMLFHITCTACNFHIASPSVSETQLEGNFQDPPSVPSAVVTEPNQTHVESSDQIVTSEPSVDMTDSTVQEDAAEPPVVPDQPEIPQSADGQELASAESNELQPLIVEEDSEIKNIAEEIIRSSIVEEEKPVNAPGDLWWQMPECCFLF